MNVITKNTFLLALFTIAIFILNSCTTDGYRIEGQLENSSGKTFYLKELTVRDILPVDSVIIAEDGKFKFKGDLEHPRFFVLQLSQKSMITLLVEPQEKIKLNADANNLSDSYMVTGSKGSLLIKDLNDKLNSNIKKIDSLGKVFRKNRKNENQNELKLRLDSVYKKIIEDQYNYLIGFIEENYTSLACIPALFQQTSPRNYILDIYKDLKYFKMVDTALIARYPELEQVKAIDAYVKDNEQKIKEKELNEKVLGIGAIAPDISLPTPQGDTLSLSSLRGKYVLLDFWASWCKPCRAENPNLVKNYTKYNKKGFEIFQVSLDRTKNAWVQAIEDDNLNWSHVSDLQYWNSGPARLYNIRGIPASFLLDKEGKIIAKNLRGNALGARLLEIFAKEEHKN